jgi:hypothetical protein
MGYKGLATFSMAYKELALIYNFEVISLLFINSHEVRGP